MLFLRPCSYIKTSLLRRCTCVQCTEEERQRKLRYLAAAILLALTITFFVCCYMTPLPVYILDRLHVRHHFLPTLDCERCNNFSAPWLILNGDFCRGKNGDFEEIALLILVASYHPNVNARQAIRHTWGSVREYKQQQIRTLFVFGTHNDKNLNNQIQYEMENYGDVIRADFADRYRSLTNKTILALQWVQKYCPNVRYVLKTDDDAFNIPQRYIDHLEKMHLDIFIGGYCFTIRPDRSPGSKFYTTVEEYPEQYYPTYCSGPGYVLSRPAITAILRVAPDSRFLHMEDVFTTGVCRVRAGIEYTQIPGTVVGPQYFDRCSVTTWVKNSHKIVPEQVEGIWEDIVLPADNLRDCRTYYLKANIVVFVMLALLVRSMYYMYKRR